MQIKNPKAGPKETPPSSSKNFSDEFLRNPVANQERERGGERDKPLNEPKPLFTNPNPGSIPKGKRSVRKIMENLFKNNYTTTVSFPLDDHKPNVEAPLMITESEFLENPIKEQVKKTQKASPKMQVWSDGDGEKVRRPRKKANTGPDPPPDLPQNFRDRIESENGSQVVLVIQKQLSCSDIEENKYRFSIPFSQIKTEFLKPEEKAVLDTRSGKKVQGIEVGLIEPCCDRETMLSMRKKEMKKPSGKSTFIYNLVNKMWNKVVSNNGLLEDMIVQLWAYRMDEELRFALVKVAN